MGRHVYNLFQDITDFSQLRHSAKMAKKGIYLNQSVLSFWSELELNLLLIQKSLKNQSYQPKPYKEFILLDPKPRKIQAADFIDRVVHHSLCKSLAPHFERSYLAHSFACQKGKGNHKAIQQVQRFSKKFSNGWFLKLDIRHCFESIHHQTLMKRIAGRIGCKHTLALIKTIVDHGGHQGKGLPIGNLTSQHFANFYLDAVDHYCVEQHRIQGFVRYMDDILLFSDSKEHLLEVLGDLTLWLPKMMHLQLKHNATQLHPVHHGIPFLGFRIFKNIVRFDQRRRKRFIKQWKSISKLPHLKQPSHFNGLICWSEQANTRQLRQNLLSNDWLQS